jgi:hypothetical protein
LLKQEASHPLGLGHREHVHDAGAWQRPQRLGDPGISLEMRLGAAQRPTGAMTVPMSRAR